MQAERGCDRRAGDVLVHQVIQRLVVGEDQRRLAARDGADLPVELLARGLVAAGGRLVDQRVDGGVLVERLVDRPAGLQHQPVEVVGVDRALLVGARDLVVSGYERVVPDRDVDRLDRHVDADLLELVAYDLPRLEQLGISRQAQIFHGQAVRVSSLGQQAFRLCEVLGWRVYAGRIVPGRSGRHFRQTEFAGAEVGEVADVGPADGERHRLTDLRIVERRLVRGHGQEVGDAGDGAGHVGEARIGLQYRHLLQRHRVRPVDLAGGQGVDAALVNRKKAERDRVQVRQPRLEVGRVALERDVVALHPLDELERTGADGLARRIAALDRLAVHDLAVGGEVGEERAERRLQVEGGGGRAGRLDRVDLGVQPRIGAGRLRIEDAIKGVLHVGRGELLAVLERRVAHQVEGPGGRVDLGPLGGEVGDEPALRVQVDQLAEDALIDLRAGVDGRRRRIEHVRLPGQCRAQSTAIGRLCGPGFGGQAKRGDGKCDDGKPGVVPGGVLVRLHGRGLSFGMNGIGVSGRRRR